MPSTAAKKKRKRQEGDTRDKGHHDLRRLLMSMELSNLSENKTEENDIGTIAFMLHGMTYTLPSSGLLKLTDAMVQGNLNNYNTIKKSMETNFGLLADFEKNLLVFFKFIKKGFKLMRDAGIHKVAEGDAEMRSSGGSDFGVDSE